MIVIVFSVVRCSLLSASIIQLSAMGSTAHEHYSRIILDVFFLAFFLVLLLTILCQYQIHRKAVFFSCAFLVPKSQGGGVLSRKIKGGFFPRNAGGGVNTIHQHIYISIS